MKSKKILAADTDIIPLLKTKNEWNNNSKSRELLLFGPPMVTWPTSQKYSKIFFYAWKYMIQKKSCLLVFWKLISAYCFTNIWLIFFCVNSLLLTSFLINHNDFFYYIPYHILKSFSNNFSFLWLYRY